MQRMCHAGPGDRCAAGGRCRRNDPAIRDDWFLSSKLGSTDEDGWLYFLDRGAACRPVPDVRRTGAWMVPVGTCQWVERDKRSGGRRGWATVARLGTHSHQSFIWYYASRPAPPPAEGVPARDPLLGWTPTPSQRATIKYFLVVAVLFLLQILTGALTAHYGVEGDSLYGIPLS
jgi:hypothetical protein